MSSGKSDYLFIDSGDDSELNGWLRRNGFRQTEENREELRKIIKRLKGGITSKNLRWTTLNNALTTNTELFKNLEKAT